MQKRTYPKIGLRSKNEIAKRISHSGFSQNDALILINDVLDNFDRYWRDSAVSQPERGKYFRSAKGKPLGVLLDKINEIILAPHDDMVPGFVFGGLKGRSNVTAVAHLRGTRKGRSILKADVTSFFEQVSERRVYGFFKYKCGCSAKAAKLLSRLCCVPTGPKDNPTEQQAIARGFATSPRLAVWCNLVIFYRAQRLIRKKLKGKNARLAIYVDDIGITACNVTKRELEALYLELEDVFMNSDKNQPLPLKEEKKKIIMTGEVIEHLGVRIHRNSLALSEKTRNKLLSIKAQLRKGGLEKAKRVALRRSYQGLLNYKKNVIREGIKELVHPSISK